MLQKSTCRKLILIGSGSIIVLCELLLAGILLFKSKQAFFWIFLLGFISAAGIAYLCRKRKAIKIISINISLVCLMLAAVEFLLYHNILIAKSTQTTGEQHYNLDNAPNIKKEGKYFSRFGNYRQANNILGYKPGNNCKIKAKLSSGNEVIYDIAYTTNAAGWRISPKPRLPEKSILFFGGSFTYGDCLADDKTFPWVCGMETGYKVLNFGFHGYGPHQMLAAIEHGIVEKILAGSAPVYAIYTAIPAHPSRCGGWMLWDLNGPEYRFDTKGKIQYTGRFNSFYTACLIKILSRSQIFTVLRQGVIEKSRTKDIVLASGIVKKASMLLQEIYPDIKFRVVYWGNADEYAKALKATGLEVIMLNKIIPDYNEHLEKYSIKYDGHPNQVAAKAVGNYLAEMITGKTEAHHE